MTASNNSGNNSTSGNNGSGSLTNSPQNSHKSKRSLANNNNSLSSSSSNAMNGSSPSSGAKSTHNLRAPAIPSGPKVSGTLQHSTSSFTLSFIALLSSFFILFLPFLCNPSFYCHFVVPFSFQFIPSLYLSSVLHLLSFDSIDYILFKTGATLGLLTRRLQRFAAIFSMKPSVYSDEELSGTLIWSRYPEKPNCTADQSSS